MEPAAKQQPSGMSCPICKCFIPISVFQLLYDGAIVCPHCGLTLTINRSVSQSAMNALKKVENAVNQVRETENFKR